jgi:type 2 lantibiotic biosynthesis protein LanM
MDGFFDRLIARAATLDELLSDEFEPLPGQKGDADLATRRLAAWCRGCASGDWSLFERRLQRDGLSLADVLARFATVRRRPSAPTPAWIDDAIWIDAALQNSGNDGAAGAAPTQGPSTSTSPALEPVAFEHLLAPVVERAQTKLWAGIGERASANLSASARAGLRHSLLKELSGLCAPALYERFGKARKAGAMPASADKPQRAATSQYDRFVVDMKAGGFRRLFEDKPVLLRLIATITRQWIDTTREFVLRLDADLATIRCDILEGETDSRVAGIEGDLSDPHNGGHSVLIVRFEDGSRVVYKPKDLRLDVAWHALVERLNRGGAPVELKAVHAIARDGYGWTEFIDHAGCAEAAGCNRFFRRAGAWLALFHCFAGSDMHQENMIATGEHPVPIDLEMILQVTAEELKTEEIEAQAFEAAMETVNNSVMMVGLLPAYARSPENKIFAMGGMTSDWTSRMELAWSNINSDTMRPAKTKEIDTSNPNLPHVDGRYAKFGDHIDDFVAGFEDYAKFLLSQSRDTDQGGLFDGFAGLPVRKVVRPTRFYYMLLQRLKNHKSMDDGGIWSAQVDFLARLADWERHSDPLWPLQRAERAALAALNVPHFVSPSDDDEIRDAGGISIRSKGTPGLDRARARVRSFDAQDIAWQVEVIRQNTAGVSRSDDPAPAAAKASRVLRSGATIASGKETFLAEADKIAADLSRHAIRQGPSAAWIGLDWLGDSEVAQLVPLGADLYNGLSGIALFLAAHAAARESKPSRELALAAVAHLRRNLKGRNAARMARSLGTGGATGLGSIVYALAVMAKCLADDDLLADAHAAADLFSDDLIAADKQLDVIGGSAGGILGLLRLHRDSPSGDVLDRARKCGDHLLAQRRVGEEGGTWLGQGSGEQALNGMSHGAAGYAYALASLAAATGRDEIAKAASQCIAFENASYDAQHNNWPDFRGDEGLLWPCQWCHGAPGIGIARAAMAKRSRLDTKLLAADVGNAIAGVEHGWPGHVDTLCCGSLGSIEFFCEAADALGRGDLRELASRRMAAIIENAAATGDYHWNLGKRQFNLGLFRGLAGVGYTCLRQADRSLPNVLAWE